MGALLIEKYTMTELLMSLGMKNPGKKKHFQLWVR